MRLQWLTRLKCFQRIAATSPSLSFPAPPPGVSGSEELLERELAADPVLERLLSCPGEVRNSKLFSCISLGNKESGALFSKKEMIVLNRFAKFNTKGLTLNELYYSVTVQFCESLRCGGSLDLRPLLNYLDGESGQSVGTRHPLGRATVEIAQHVFSVWLEAAVARLSEAELRELDAKGNNGPIVSAEDFTATDMNGRRTKRPEHEKEGEEEELLELMYGLGDFTAVSSRRVR